MSLKNFFLVGDIIDGWSLKRKWRWPQEHSDIIQKILRTSRKGTKVVYVLGNHDEFMRPFLPIYLGDNINIVDSYDYVGIDGKKYWVIHGDFFDSITMTKKWLAVLGDRGYQLLLSLNRPLNKIRKIFNKDHWSLAAFVKQSVKKSLMYIGNYEEVVSSQAKKKKYDGVICGHIHHAQDKDFKGIRYLNCGDWVESCTAVVEDFDGNFKVIQF